MKLAWVCFLIRDIKIEMKPSPRIYQGLNDGERKHLDHQLSQICGSCAQPFFSHPPQGARLPSPLRSYMVGSHHYSKTGCPPNWPQSLTKHFLIFAFLFPWSPAVFSWWSTVCLWNVSDLLGLRSSYSRDVSHLTVQAIGPSLDLNTASLPREKWRKERSPVVYFRNNYLPDNPFIGLRNGSLYLSICYTHCI